MVNPWDQIALTRHQYLLERKDIVFDQILLPTIERVLKIQQEISTLDVLDVGCGTGVITGKISNFVNSIVGIDPSRESINIAKDHTKGASNVKMECVSISEFSKHHEEIFDFAIAHMTLHSIENLELAMSGVSKVLKQGCSFLFSIPHPCFWAMIFEESFKNNYKYQTPSFHENNFMGAKTPHYHRSLDLYCSVSFKSGFIIENIIEPFAPDGLMEEHNKREWEYPGFLFFQCRKY